MKLTKAQKRLKKLHGTPEEFADACRACLEITHQEEVAAIHKYRREWDEAGKRKHLKQGD